MKGDRKRGGERSTIASAYAAHARTWTTTGESSSSCSTTMRRLIYAHSALDHGKNTPHA